jgi:hypothetical protein
MAKLNFSLVKRANNILSVHIIFLKFTSPETVIPVEIFNEEMLDQMLKGHRFGVRYGRRRKITNSLQFSLQTVPLEAVERPVPGRPACKKA